MSLVWLGHALHDLRQVRGESIGAERGLNSRLPWLQALLKSSTGHSETLATRDQRIITRFIADMDRLCRSLSRVTRPAGHVVFVVANSQVRGTAVSNAHIATVCAERHGFELTNDQSRELPAKHRYLPPPSSSDGTLGTRMKTEQVLTFRACQ